MVLGEVGQSVALDVRESLTSMRPRVGSRGSAADHRDQRHLLGTSMRPRVGSRGSPVFGSHTLLITGTSMRPRVGSRGSVLCQMTFDLYLNPTSMRPRVGSRGSRARPVLHPAARDHFNEAPSWFSGKSIIVCRISSRATFDFNEAPSWFSGK